MLILPDHTTCQLACGKRFSYGKLTLVLPNTLTVKVFEIKEGEIVKNKRSFRGMSWHLTII